MSSTSGYVGEKLFRELGPRLLTCAQGEAQCSQCELQRTL